MLKNVVLLSLCGFGLPIQAQIALDGTLGPKITLPGPDYQIGAKLGQQHGGNLFHSFSDFNLSQGETVTFAGPDNVNNVINRVTGGRESHLDGLLRSTIPAADVYLINPAGIHFGPHASLDISGSFHASSADVLRFEDGGSFNANQPDNSVLTIAPVTAFGFLTDSPGALSVEGSDLSVLEKQSFSLIGGEITMNQAQLEAPFGRLNLASVANQGEIALEPSALKLAGPRGNITIRDSQINLNGEGGGAIYLQGGQIVMRESEIEASTLGTAAGRGVTIRADQLTMEGGYLFSDTLGSGRGGDIDVEAGSVNLEAGALLTADIESSSTAGSIVLKVDTLLITGEGSYGSSRVSAQVNNLGATGTGGEVKIQARQVTLAEGGKLSVSNFGEGNAGKLILTATDTLLITGGSLVRANGTGGNIEIETQQITLAAGGGISAGTLGQQGNGGNITLTVTDTLLITEASFIESLAGLSTTGNSGNIEIKAKQVKLEAEGQISVDSFGQGHGGNITLTATDTLLITGASFVSSSAGFGSTGNGGDIKIKAKQVRLEAEGQISIDTSGLGDGGNLTLTAADTLLITGASFVESLTNATGNGGNIEIEAKQVILKAGGQINTSTFFGQGEGGTLNLRAADTLLITGDSIVASSVLLATGAGGNIEIEAHQVKLEAGGVISVGTFGPGKGGKLKLTSDTLLITQGSAVHAESRNNGGTAGNLTITANDNIRLQNEGRISTATDGAPGGDISITTAGLLYLTDSEISTSVQANQGNGGNIKPLNPLFIVLDESKILAQATEGHGGDINIETNDIYVFMSNTFPQTDHQKRLNEAINASSELGIDGIITIDSPDINVGKNLIVFPTTLIDASSQLKKCIATALSDRSHFYVKRLPAQRWVADNLKSSRFLLVQTDTPVAQTTEFHSAKSPQLAWLIGCHQDMNQKQSTGTIPTQLF